MPHPSCSSVSLASSCAASHSVYRSGTCLFQRVLARRATRRTAPPSLPGHRTLPLHQKFFLLFSLHQSPSCPEARPVGCCRYRRVLRHVRLLQPWWVAGPSHWRTSMHPNSLNLQPWMMQQKGCKIGLPLTLHNGWLSNSRAAKSKARENQALSLTADNL